MSACTDALFANRPRQQAFYADKPPPGEYPGCEDFEILPYRGGKRKGNPSQPRVDFIRKTEDAEVIGYRIGVADFPPLVGLCRMRMLLLHAGESIGSDHLAMGATSMAGSAANVGATDKALGRTGRSSRPTEPGAIIYDDAGEDDKTPKTTDPRARAMAAIVAQHDLRASRMTRQDIVAPHMVPEYLEWRKDAGCPKVKALVNKSTFNGRSKQFNDEKLKGYHSVQPSIQYALDALQDQALTADIAKHLRANIKTGEDCTYTGNWRWKF